MNSYFDDEKEEFEIVRDVAGHTDPNTGKWIKGGRKVLIKLKGDLQPKSGQRRVLELQTKYESEYILYVDIEDVLVKIKSIAIIGRAAYDDWLATNDIKGLLKQGDVLVDSENKEYDIIFISNWKSHFEAELKVIS